MKMFYGKITMSFIATIFLVSMFGNPLAQAEQEDVDEEEVQEMAEVLEFIDQEVIETDGNGNITHMDIDAYEEEFGEDHQLDELRETMQENVDISGSPMEVIIQSQYDTPNECFNSEVADQYGDILTGAAVDSIIAAIEAGNYTDAGRELVRAGASVAPASAGINLMTILGQCVYEVNGFWPDL